MATPNTELVLHQAIPVSAMAGHAEREAMTVTYHVRFWSKVDQRGLDECWPWLGSRTNLGYGSFRGRGKTAKAHRVAWALANGDIELTPADKICHHCDNPPCCNPAHLYRGTQSTNVADMMARGRALSTEQRRLACLGKMPTGEAHWTRRMPERVKRGWRTTFPEHGDYRKYVQGCRCTDCRSANAAYKRQLRERKVG